MISRGKYETVFSVTTLYIKLLAKCFPLVSHPWPQRCFSHPLFKENPIHSTNEYGMLNILDIEMTMTQFLPLKCSRPVGIDLQSRVGER